MGQDLETKKKGREGNREREERNVGGMMEGKMEEKKEGMEGGKKRGKGNENSQACLSEKP